MPWTSSTIMDQRREFIHLATSGAVPIAELARRFGISRKTAHKWLRRFGTGELDDVRPSENIALRYTNESRRPHHSPRQLPSELEERILALREAYPHWGARKLRVLLGRALPATLPLPAVSTVHQVLVRHGKISAEASAAARPYQRFEHARPNDLWQMDFKGDFALMQKDHVVGRCHPLTVLDDHSRFNVVLHAADNERTVTVQQALTEAFRHYGLPERFTMDNGAPWGNDERHGFTPLTVWLLRLGIRISHSRPYHPQTQGKDERFHRSLKTEVITPQTFSSLDECQQAFDRWRDVYNTIRPHEGIALQTPAERYHPSPRTFPEVLPAIEYPAGSLVRKVGDKGRLHFRGSQITIPKAFKGYPVALLPTDHPQIFDIIFHTTPITTVDLSTVDGR